MGVRMATETIKNVVYERPGVLVLSDIDWQRGSGINIRLKCSQPEDLTKTFSASQIKKSVELVSAIETGQVKVLSDDEARGYVEHADGKMPDVLEGGITITPDGDSDQFMGRLAEVEDKEEKLNEALSHLRMTPRKNKGSEKKSGKKE